MKRNNSGQFGFGMYLTTGIMASVGVGLVIKGIPVFGQEIIGPWIFWVPLAAVIFTNFLESQLKRQGTGQRPK